MRSEFNFHWTNWAGNQSCNSGYYFEPETEDDIILLVKKAAQNNQKIRVAGSGHSFSALVPTKDVLLSLCKYTNVISTIGNLVTVQSGIVLKELYDHLRKSGLSLPNYGVINKQTIAGALSTGTHGSGLKYKSLSSYIHSIKIIKADGTPVLIHRNTTVVIDGKEFSIWQAVGISLGLLGIISEITLECEPLFYVRSEERKVSFNHYLENMDRWAKEFDYFKGWWFPHTDHVFVYFSNRITEDQYQIEKQEEKYSEEQKNRDAEMDGELASLFQQSLKEPLLTPIINLESLEYYFTSRIRYGTPMEILVHDETVPMIVSEYALSMKKNHHKNVLIEFRNLIEENHQLHFPVDLRYAAAEDLLLSPSLGEPVFYIGMCVREYQGTETPEVMQAFIQLMRKNNGRPNWGKISDYSQKDFVQNYPAFGIFNTIRSLFDPKNMFLNREMENWFGQNS